MPPEAWTDRGGRFSPASRPAAAPGPDLQARLDLQARRASGTARPSGAAGRPVESAFSAGAAKPAGALRTGHVQLGCKRFELLQGHNSVVIGIRFIKEPQEPPVGDLVPRELAVALDVESHHPRDD